MTSDSTKDSLMKKIVDFSTKLTVVYSIPVYMIVTVLACGFYLYIHLAMHLYLFFDYSHVASLSSLFDCRYAYARLYLRAKA